MTEVRPEIALIANTVRTACSEPMRNIDDHAEYWVGFIISAAATLAHLKETDPANAQKALAQYVTTPTVPVTGQEQVGTQDVFAGWFVPDA